jgi:O-antigen/teichoic acid export membrane protein
VNAPGNLARRLVRNTLHAASGRLIAVFVWLVLTPFILHALGSEGFAVWSLFYALTGYLSSLDFGLASGTVKHVAAARTRDDHAEAGAFATLAMLGYTLLASLWLIATWTLRVPVLHWLRIPASHFSVAEFAMVAGAVIFALSGFANVTMAIAQGYQRFDLSNRILLTLTAQQAIGIPIVLWRGWGLAGLIVNLGVGWLLAALVGMRLVRRHLGAFRWQPTREALKQGREALAFGGPIQINNVLSVLHTQMDKFLLVRFVTLAAVTPYELGFRVVSTASTFPQLLLLAVLPTASEIHAGPDPQRLRELFERGSRYVLTAAAVAIAPMLGCADRLYAAWLGGPHPDAALALRGLALTAFVALATGMGTSVARGIGRTDLEAWFAFVALAVHVALSLWLMPMLGLRGALIAILAGNLVGATYFLSRLARALRWPLFRTMIGPVFLPALAVAAGAISGATVDRALPRTGHWTEWLALALSGGASALVALALLVTTRYIPWREARGLVLRRGASS